MTSGAAPPTAVFADETWPGLATVRCLNDLGWPVAERSPRAAAELESPAWELVLLPLSLAEQVLQQGRPKQKRLPAIIALFGPAQYDAGIHALEAGADDCFAQSGSPRELLARLRAVVRGRRAALSPWRLGPRLVFGDCFLSRAEQALRPSNGAPIVLTRREIGLLNAFLDHPEAVLSRTRLIDMVLGDDADVYDRSIDCYVCRLRRKLARATGHDLIVTFPGAGYAFRPGSPGRHRTV